MKITREQKDNVLTFTVEGRIDTMTAPDLNTAVSEINYNDIDIVVLDGKDLEFVSSAGLRVIVSLYKSVTANSKSLKLVNINDMVLDVLTMTGMSDYLDIEQA